MSPLLQGLLQECLFKKSDLVQKNGIWHNLPTGEQLPKGWWYYNGVFARRCPIPMAAPLTIWWRWAHSYRGYSRGVYQKNSIWHKNGIWHILLTGKQLPKGGWYHNGVFARRCPHPHGSSPDNLVEMSPLLLGLLQGCLPKKMGFSTKKTAFGTFYSLVSSSPQADSIRMGSF